MCLENCLPPALKLHLLVSNAKEFDRPGVKISSAAKAASSKQVPESTFRAVEGEGTITREQYDHLGCDKPDWPNHNPENYRLVAMQSLSMTKFGGDYSKLQKSWLSLLMMPGTLVMNRGDHLGPRLILAACAHGFWSYRCPVQNAGRHFLLDFDTQLPDQLMFDCVADLRGWRCVEVKIALPGDSAWGTAARGDRLTALSQSGAEDLLPFSLKRGLRNMSVHFMKKLYVFLGVGGESRTVPKTETELISSISKFVLGQGYNEGAGKQIMLARAGDEKDVDEVVNSPLFHGDYADILEAEVDTTGLKEEIARQAELAERRRVGKAQRQAAIEAAHSGSGPSAAQSAAPRLKPLPSPPTGLTQKEAKELLPPGANVSKTSVWDSRWSIRASYLGQKSRTFKGGDVQSDHEALRYCLTVAWAAYAQSTGQGCPWDLGSAI